jgi:hypothetical protein
MINAHGFFTESARYSFQVSIKLEFSRHIFEKNQIPYLIKISPVGAKLFHAGGQTDRHDEANSRFYQF